VVEIFPIIKADWRETGQQVPNVRDLPLATACRSDATVIQSNGQSTEAGNAGVLNFLHDRQNGRGEPLGLLDRDRAAAMAQPARSSHGRGMMRMTQPVAAAGLSLALQAASSATSTSTTPTIQASFAKEPDFFNSLLGAATGAHAANSVLPQPAFATIVMFIGVAIAKGKLCCCC
jgi:hypothetical protein